MALGGVARLSYKNLVSYTDNFNESNYIGFFQYGKFYRGEIPPEESVMVKIWEVPESYRYWPGDNESRLMDEITLLRHEMVNHLGMVKLYGFCFEGIHLGAVYQFKPMDSVYNLIPKVSLGGNDSMLPSVLLPSSIFCTLTKLQISNPSGFAILTAHIMLDEDYNPKLCDFGLMTGGIFPDRSPYFHYIRAGCRGYIDNGAYVEAPLYEDKKDVYAFGVILLSLISKRVYNSKEGWKTDESGVGAWAADKYYDFMHPSSDDDEGSKSKKLKLSEEPPKFLLVDESLVTDPDYDPDDGYDVTAVGIRCVEGPCCDRPTMREVLISLLSLKVAKEHCVKIEEDSAMAMD